MGQLRFASGLVVGSGSGALLIAEAGVNHNGSREQALRLVDAAAEAGVDAVKFQAFRVDQLVTRNAEKAPYQVDNDGVGTQYGMLRALQLDAEDLHALADRCQEHGLLFLGSAFDAGSARALLALGVPLLKLASGEVTNHLLLEDVAGLGVPVLLSTGMSTLLEVRDAVAVLRRAACSDLQLMHCVTDYPAAPWDCNLRAMHSMRESLGVPVGLSDHSLGSELALAAAALGASVIEKHFTLDRTLAGPDHAASLEPLELAALVKGVRAVEAALGDGEKRPRGRESENARVARRSLFLARDVPAGHVLVREDLAALRPATGIPPSRYRELLGRRLRAAASKGSLLSFEQLE